MISTSWQRKPFASFTPTLPITPQSHNKPAQPPQDDSMRRVVQYGADNSGCGLYRLGWVSHLLNYQNKLSVTDTCVMIDNPRWYHNVKTVRLQRQATTAQKEFVKFLNSIKDQMGFKIVYEVDDVVFREDIPDYNKFKFAFVSDEIRNNVTEIINMCDEVTVTNTFMKDLYTERTGKKEITVIPNFPAKFWIGNYYNERRVDQLFDMNRKRPRVLYAGSGAHFDVDNRTGQKDDFENVLKSIIDTRHKYQYVFLGAFPLALRKYIECGDIEFHKWQRLYDYPQKIWDLGVQMMIAPLQVGNFNKAKSDLKYIEACCYGLPIACQNMCTYADAPLKFDTGEEMIERMEEALKPSNYKKRSDKRREVAENRFLEHDRNLDCYVELFTTGFGDPKRVNLKRYN